MRLLHAVTLRNGVGPDTKYLTRTKKVACKMSQVVSPFIPTNHYDN